jgi:hypothetical protein
MKRRFLFLFVTGLYAEASAMTVATFSMETLTLQTEGDVNDETCGSLIQYGVSRLPFGSTCQCGHNMEDDLMLQCHVPIATVASLEKSSHLFNTITMFFVEDRVDDTTTASLSLTYAVDCLCYNQDCQVGSLSFDDYCVFIYLEDDDKPSCSVMWMETKEQCGPEDCALCLSQDEKYFGVNVNACYDYDQCMDTFIAPLEPAVHHKKQASTASFDQICTHLSNTLEPAYDCECIPNMVEGKFDVVECRLGDDVLRYYFDSDTAEPAMELDCNCAGGICTEGSRCFMVTFDDDVANTDPVPICSQVKLSATPGEVDEECPQNTCTFCGMWGPGFWQVASGASPCRVSTVQGCLSTKLLPYDRVMPSPTSEDLAPLPSKFETACAHLQDYYESTFEDTHCLCHQLTDTHLTASCVIPNDYGYFLNNVLWFFDKVTGDPHMAIHCHCNSEQCGANEEDFCYTIYFRETGPTCLIQFPHSGAVCHSETFGGQCSVTENSSSMYYHVLVEDCETADNVLLPGLVQGEQQTLIIYPLPD